MCETQDSDVFCQTSINNIWHNSSFSGYSNDVCVEISLNGEVPGPTQRKIALISLPSEILSVAPGFFGKASLAPARGSQTLRLPPCF